MTVFEKISQQQAGKEGTPEFFVGEQLKEICYADPHCAEIVGQDLDSEAMGLKKAAQKIKDYADEQHKKDKGNFVWRKGSSGSSTACRPQHRKKRHRMWRSRSLPSRICSASSEVAYG